MQIFKFLMWHGIKFLTGSKQGLNNGGKYTTTRELLVHSPATFWKGTIFFLGKGTFWKGQHRWMEIFVLYYHWVHVHLLLVTGVSITCSSTTPRDTFFGLTQIWQRERNGTTMMIRTRLALSSSGIVGKGIKRNKKEEMLKKSFHIP